MRAINVSAFSLKYNLGLYAFLSTPKFIKSLSDISLNLSAMKGVPKDEKLRQLKTELHKVNRYLPASVYIPFVNSKEYLNQA